MSNTLKALAFALLLMFGAPAQAQTQRLPPEAYGALPQIEFAAVSPDGTKIAVGRNIDGQASVVVIDIATGTHLYSAETGERVQLRGVGWVDDQRVQLYVTQTVNTGVFAGMVRFSGRPGRIDIERIGIANLMTRRVTLLTTDEAHAWSNSTALAAPIEGDPGYGRMIGFTSAYTPAQLRLFRINLDNSNARMVSVEGVNRWTDAIIVDTHGEPAARVDIDEMTNRWTVYGYVSGAPRQLLQGVSRTGSPWASPQGLLPDQRLAVLDYERENDRLIAIDRATGVQEVLYSRGQGGIEDVIGDATTGYIVGVAYFQDSQRQHFFDPQLQAMVSTAEQLAPNGEARLVNWSRDRSRAVVYIEQGLDGGGYYMLQAGHLSRIGMRYPRVAEAAGATGSVRQAITYPARDGVRIPAFLTLPDGETRNLPLVLLVHGGPEAHDELSFDYWAAFLASRGYAVLQPNYRGSDGYGLAWSNAGHRQWGGLMQTDVEDGVAAMIRAGMADASRVCIVGASYGGYAALAGATLTPDRYRCAVSVAGLSDLDAFVQQRIAQTGVNSGTADYWRMSIGDHAEDRAAIRAVSPINLVDRVRIPILLIHGTDDTVVPFSQSREMDQRLRDAGKNSRLVTLRRDDHWLSDGATRTQMLSEIESFLAQHLAAH